MAVSSVRPTLSQWSGAHGRSVGIGTNYSPGLAGFRTGVKRQTSRKTTSTAPGQYMGAGPEKVSEIEDLFDETGLPTRLPRNRREAMLFQLQASRAARQQQARQTAAALSSLRYGVGMTQFASPYGLGALMSPLLGQMAGVQERVQFAPSDFSYFVRPDAYGEQTGATDVRSASSYRSPVINWSGARRTPSPIGMGFQPEPVAAQPVPSYALPVFNAGMDAVAPATQPLMGGGSYGDVPQINYPVGPGPDEEPF
jgi:hypothetical protein